MNCPICNNELLEISPKTFHCSQVVQFHSCHGLPHYELDDMLRSIVVVHPYILIEQPESNSVIIRKFHPPDTNIHQFNPYAFTSIVGSVPTKLIISADLICNVSKLNLNELSFKIKRLEKLKIFT
jgi:hypothetical protein